MGIGESEKRGNGETRKRGTRKPAAEQKKGGPMARPKYLSLDGKVVPYADAKIHVLSPAVTWGTTVFEGIRAYWNSDEGQLHVFRLRDHTARLFQSMRMIRFDHPYDADAIERPILELLRANEFREDVHIRQMVYLSEEVPMTATAPVGMAIAAIPKPSTPLVQNGMHVSVEYKKDGDKMVAVAIKASAPKAAPKKEAPKK